jgi:hypothetical protein
MNPANVRLSVLLKIAELEEYLFQVLCLITEKRQVQAYVSLDQIEADTRLAAIARLKIRAQEEKLQALAA